jgi:hypothetical protein
MPCSVLRWLIINSGTHIEGWNSKDEAITSTEGRQALNPRVSRDPARDPRPLQRLGCSSAADSYGVGHGSFLLFLHNLQASTLPHLRPTHTPAKQLASYSRQAADTACRAGVAEVEEGGMVVAVEVQAAS